LIDAIEKYKFDAFLSGAHRDEEKLAQKNAFSTSGMNLIHGTPKINDLNFVTYVIQVYTEKTG